jgi:uncharacterized protein YjiS (DUF1127 family)
MFDLPSASGSVAGIGAAVRRALEWPAHVMEARRTLAQLARMSDRELVDIGLTRQDLCDCTALPLDDDPSEKLARERANRAWLTRRRSDIVAPPPRRDLAA